MKEILFESAYIYLRNERFPVNESNLFLMINGKTMNSFQSPFYQGQGVKIVYNQNN